MKQSGAGEHAVLGIAHTGITVSDLARSLNFYRTVLGFETTSPLRIQGPSVERITGIAGAVLDVAFARTAHHVIELLSFVSPRTTARIRMQPSDAGFFHLCLKVTDIERALEAMRAADFNPVDSIETLQEGPARGMKIVYARDPDGVCLELAQDAPGIVFENLFFRQTPPAIQADGTHMPTATP